MSNKQKVDLKTAYEYYKNYDVKQIHKDISDSQWNQTMTENVGQAIPRKEFDAVASIVKELSYDQFVTFVKTDALPPLKLNASQMEALKAGGKYFNADMTWGDVIGWGVGAVIGVAIT